MQGFFYNSEKAERSECSIADKNIKQHFFVSSSSDFVLIQCSGHFQSQIKSQD